MAHTLLTHSESETEALGRALGRRLQPGDVVALVGDLGAGKTCLTRGIAAGLGIEEPVASPTFILVAEYPTASGFPLYHADCYRLDNPAREAEDIGLDELMADHGAVVVEWADRIAALLPPDHLRVTLEIVDDHSRRITLEPTGPRAARLVDGLWNGRG